MSPTAQWQEYICRLKSLPSIAVETEGRVEQWDNLFDYYATRLCVPATVADLAQLEPCAARAVLGDMAVLLDESIAQETSWWNWFADTEETTLMQTLRRAL